MFGETAFPAGFRLISRVQNRGMTSRSQRGLLQRRRPILSSVRHPDRAILLHGTERGGNDHTRVAAGGNAGFAKYVENARFAHNGVLFATAHVVGSNNNFEPGAPETAMEHFERDAANAAWIDDTFRKARETGAKAMVLAWQADVQDILQKWPTMPRASGFVKTVQAVERGARSFSKPILIVHGDEHQFQVGSFLDTSKKPMPNVLRLEVMGETHVHAVRVLVDPDSAGVFGFVPLIVPENVAR
jgi:hypothetical protein